MIREYPEYRAADVPVALRDKIVESVIDDAPAVYRAMVTPAMRKRGEEKVTEEILAVMDDPTVQATIALRVIQEYERLSLLPAHELAPIRCRLVGDLARLRAERTPAQP